MSRLVRGGAGLGDGDHRVTRAPPERRLERDRPLGSAP
jgi:hypothetical protein